MLDEPMNGLDPDGMVWLRDLLRKLAAEGRAILVSSHLMTEMQHLATHLVVIGHGRLIADTTVTDLMTAGGHVRVRTPQPDRLAIALTDHGAKVERAPGGSLSVAGLDAIQIGELAAAHAIPTHELTTPATSLEDTFLELTKQDTEYRGRTR